VTVGAEPWLGELLSDAEWLRDLSRKGREEALQANAEIEGRSSVCDMQRGE
jgi:hypothetical protein